jgi:outer membrane protein OmpA-like peptidoglycan-associated protein
MRLLLRVFCLSALCLATAVPGFSDEPEKPKAKEKSTAAAGTKSSAAKSKPAPAPKAAAQASTPGSPAEDKQLRPMPPTVGLNGLFTLESGEALPAKSVTVGAGVNKFSRNPGSITVLETQVGLGVGLSKRWSVFVEFDPNRHIHSGLQDRLSLNTPVFCPQVGTTIYRAISCNPGGAAAYVEDFPFANRNTGGVGDITTGVKFNVLSQGRGNPFGFSLRTDFIIPTVTGLSSLLDNTTQTGQFKWNILGAVTRSFGNLLEGTLNVGYTVVRNPHSGGVELLQEANQFHAGVGFLMFPRSRIQVITEYNGLIFTGSHTPNTLFGARDPVDATYGLRLYPLNWLAMDIGYRYAINQLASNDRHGFVIRLGTTYLKPPPPPPVNHPPTAACSASASSVYVGSGDTVNVSVNASDPDNDPLNYAYTASGGTIEGAGPQVRWNSAGLVVGSYTVTARVDDGRGGVASCAVDIRVEPKPNRPPVMACKADRASVISGERVRISANATDPDNDPLNYAWRTNGGQIVGSGDSVQLDTTGLAPGSYTVTGRVDDGRGGAADCNVDVRVENPPVPPQASKLNECFFRSGSARVDNVCKRVLDDVALRLGAAPKDRAVLVGFSDPAEGKTDKLAKQRAENAKKYLAGKGVADSRVETRAAGGQKGAGKQNLRLDVIMVPEGATY